MTDAPTTRPISASRHSMTTVRPVRPTRIYPTTPRKSPSVDLVHWLGIRMLEDDDHPIDEGRVLGRVSEILTEPSRVTFLGPAAGDVIILRIDKTAFPWVDHLYSGIRTWSDGLRPGGAWDRVMKSCTTDSSRCCRS